jgi:hypothetical protein
MRFSPRSLKTKLSSSKKDDSQVTRERKEMDSLTRNFFIDLYATDPNVCSQDVLHLFEPMISEEMNNDLCKDFTKSDL